MNHVTGYARPVGMGYWAMLRFDRDSKPKPVLGKGGKPIIYPTEAAALRVVVTHLCSYFTSDIVGWESGGDDRFSAARKKAELIFLTPKKPAAERAGE